MLGPGWRRTRLFDERGDIGLRGSDLDVRALNEHGERVVIQDGSETIQSKNRNRKNQRKVAGVSETTCWRLFSSPPAVSLLPNYLIEITQG